MSGVVLKKLYDNPDKVVVTAHRGFSNEYPENTVLAFQKAAALPVDIIEFDIRATSDGVPVILHDDTADRTSDAAGRPEDHTLAELREHNFSYWEGSQVTGHRLDEPAHADVTIPTFAEALEAIPRNAGLNMQFYAVTDSALAEVCRLYDEHDVYERGYLTMNDFEDAQRVRDINPRIELCVIQGQGQMDLAMLKRYKDFGCTFIQPHREDVNAEFCQAAREMGLCTNMFWSNTDEDNREFIGLGLRGLLTDCPDVLIQTVRDLGLT